jgi:hypothetical protein
VTVPCGRMRALTTTPATPMAAQRRECGSGLGSPRVSSSRLVTGPLSLSARRPGCLLATNHRAWSSGIGQPPRVMRASSSKPHPWSTYAPSASRPLLPGSAGRAALPGATSVAARTCRPGRDPRPPAPSTPRHAEAETGHSRTGPGSQPTSTGASHFTHAPSRRYVVAGAYGLDSSASSFGHIGGWARGDWGGGRRLLEASARDPRGPWTSAVVSSAGSACSADGSCPTGEWSEHHVAAQPGPRRS